MDILESMVGAEKRRNVPYDESTIQSACGLLLRNMAETSRDYSEQDKLFKVTQYLKTVFGSRVLSKVDESRLAVFERKILTFRRRNFLLNFSTPCI